MLYYSPRDAPMNIGPIGHRLLMGLFETLSAGWDGFLLKRAFFPLIPQFVTAEALVFTHNAMTWNYQSNGIRCTSSSYCTRGARPPHCTGDFAVGPGASIRYFAELLPNAPLKCGGSHIQR